MPLLSFDRTVTHQNTGLVCDLRGEAGAETLLKDKAVLVVVGEMTGS